MGEFEQIAEKELKDQITVLDALVDCFEEIVRCNIHRQVDAVRYKAKRLDKTYASISGSVEQATKAKEIAAILYHIRGDVIRFIYSLVSTRQLLMLIAAKSRVEAHRDGLRSAAGFLEIELGMHRTELLAEEATKPWDQRQALTTKAGLKMLTDVVLLPLRVRHDVRLGSESGKQLGARLQRLFTSATKGLRTRAWKDFISVVWGEIQEHWGLAVAVSLTVVFAVIGWVLGQFITTLKFAVLLALAVFVLQAVLQRWFDDKHLKWYRGLCIHTVHTLFVSQVKAACSIVGLEEIGNSEPK